MWGKGHISRDCATKEPRETRDCYECGETGHKARDCPTVEKEPEEENKIKRGVRATNSAGKKVASGGKGKSSAEATIKAKKASDAKSGARVSFESDVDEDGENGDTEVDSDDEYIDRSLIVVFTNPTKSSGVEADSTGPLIDLVKDSGATAPMTFRKQDLIEYRKSDSRNKHWVEVADGVKYQVRGYGKWAGWVTAKKRGEQIWMEIDDVLFVPELSERLLSAGTLRKCGHSVILEPREGYIKTSNKVKIPLKKCRTSELEWYKTSFG